MGKIRTEGVGEVQEFVDIVSGLCDQIAVGLTYRILFVISVTMP